MSGPRVLLMQLSIRTSAKGNQYLSGWLGKAQVVGFPGEADRFGNATWDIYVSEPERRDAPSGAGARPVSRSRPAPAGCDDFDDHEQLGRIGR